MARQGDNQIQPAARPVQAFIEPVRVSVVEPARPVQLPGFGQPQTVQQGATPNVQGANGFERLAGNLEAFNRQLTPLLQQMGLRYADQQMQQGEARARAEALRGMAQNDAAMEKAEQDRAKANRALAKRDPAAAGIMALLNPYDQIGYERGKAKLAGAEVSVGLPEYIRQNAGSIDYTQPDQGQGAVRRLADTFTADLMQRYGLTADNPMAQRFVVPEVEKAREKVGLQIARDRSDALKGQRIQQTAALIRGIYDQAQSANVVEFAGQTYSRNDPTPERRALFAYALRARMQEVLGMATKSGVMPGEGREIQQKVWDSLNAQGWYGREGLRALVNSLDSTDKVLDANGREVLDPRTGKPVYHTLGSIYQQADIDNEIKYKAAMAASRRIDREDESSKFEKFIYDRIGKYPTPGPEREAARTLAIAEYWNANAKRLDGIGWSKVNLIKIAQDVGKLTSEVYFEDQPDPDMPERALAALSQVRGSSWNARDAYRYGEQVAQHYRDPAQRGKFLIRWNAEVAKLDKENSSMAGYKEPRDSTINNWVNTNLNSYYGPSSQRNQGDRSASRSLQWQAAVPYVNAVLMQEEAKKKSRLSDAEVRKITADALGKYGSGPNGKEQKDYLFPGSTMTQTPGITPRTKPQNHGYGPAPGPSRSTGAAPATTPMPVQVFDINQLDAIPDRKIVLRNYEKQAVLSAGGLKALVDAVAGDRPFPKAFEKAWRDAGAPNAGEFIMRQLERYPGVFELPPQLQRKIQLRAAAEAGASDYMLSLQATQQRFPQLASVVGGLLDVVTGARPVSAAMQFEDGGGGTVSHPTLSRLASGRMVEAPMGKCVTAVLNTLQANGLPNPQAAGGDVGNNPRGLASQLIRQYGWQPLPGLGQEQIIRSPYGTFAANVIPERDYLAAVQAGRIPSGALVFSTRHGTWQGTSPGSRGYDVAVARNGGRNLWNGYLSGADVYSGASKWRMVLVPKGSTASPLAQN